MGAEFLQAGGATTGGISASVVTVPSFTLSGDNRNLVVIVGVRASSPRTIAEMLRGSDTFEQKAYAHHPTGAGQIHAWLFNSTNEPQLASAPLVVTLGGGAAPNFLVMYLASCGVNQNSRINAITKNVIEQGPSDSSVNVASVSGDLVVDGLVQRGAGAPTVREAGQTQRVAQEVTQLIVGRMSTVPGEAITAIGWNGIDPDDGVQGFVHFGWNHPGSFRAEWASMANRMIGGTQ